MSNSQEQSLDESAVFLPVIESCPQFFHSERERFALEELLNAGPEAFYARLRAEHLGEFLSSEEVRQITDWAESYQLSPWELEEDADGIQSFSDCYFPLHSDAPAPCLELGWPERTSWTREGGITVYTSPPAEGQPPVREIIRRLLQGATQVIALVTDRLTDSAVVGDLNSAASRGVPVYIILNQRTVAKGSTATVLSHPNIRVRVLRGKPFCSRDAKMVVGESKANFLLVDLETVVHGSYSLTWTDAHLHRQLVTVLQGPVLESFDQEFRILFAASVSLSNAVDLVHQQNLSCHPGSPKPAGSLLVPSSPTSPWDDCRACNGPVSHRSEVRAQDPPLNATPLKKKPSATVGGSPWCKMEHGDSRPPWELNLDPERDPALRPAEAGQTLSPRAKRLTPTPHSRAQRGPHMEGSGTENIYTSKRPIILRVREAEGFSSLSDIMRRLQPRQSSPGQRHSTAMHELSRSMMDLSVQRTAPGCEGRVPPTPRQHASFFDPGRITPGFAKMKNRGHEIKPTINRAPISYLPSARPLAPGSLLDWRRLQTDTQTGPKEPDGQAG